MHRQATHEVRDWLSATPMGDFWQQQRGSLLGIAAIIVASVGTTLAARRCGS